jgi:CRISPR-associated protein Cmr5
VQSLEQRRAAFALGKVESVRAEIDRAKFKTQLVKLPARLHTSGLGQTVAFYLSTGEGKPEWRICGWLEEWLRPRVPYDQNHRLIDSLTGESEEKYRRAAAEARALAVWLKRFAEAYLEGEGG